MPKRTLSLKATTLPLQSEHGGWADGSGDKSTLQRTRIQFPVPTRVAHNHSQVLFEGIQYPRLTFPGPKPSPRMAHPYMQLKH